MVAELFILTCKGIGYLSGLALHAKGIRKACTALKEYMVELEQDHHPISKSFSKCLRQNDIDSAYKSYLMYKASKDKEDRLEMIMKELLVSAIEENIDILERQEATYLTKGVIENKICDLSKLIKKIDLAPPNNR